MGNRLSKIYTRTGDEGTTGLGDGTRQGFFARDAAQRPAARLERVDDLLYILHPRVIGAGQPERVDRGIRDEIADRGEGSRVSDVQIPRKPGGVGGVLAVRAPYAAHVRVANSAERLHVKARVETAADEPDPKALLRAAILFLSHMPEFSHGWISDATDRPEINAAVRLTNDAITTAPLSRS